MGDWAQLSAIEAGGAFGMLVRDRERAPELTGVHRFTHEWEREASLALRIGDRAVVDAYLAHGRLHKGTRTSTVDHAYSSWLDDQRNGL